MTNRELLELAAKAAGYEFAGYYFDEPMIRSAESAGDACRGNCISWNPLDDDGDALRLAVRLHIKILIGDAWLVDESTGEHRTLFRVSPDEEPCQYAATRLAITRAAAEIGRSMP